MKKVLLVCGLAVLSLMAVSSTGYAESPRLESKTVLEHNHGRYGYNRGGWNRGGHRWGGNYRHQSRSGYYYQAQPVPQGYHSGNVYYCR